MLGRGYHYRHVWWGFLKFLTCLISHWVHCHGKAVSIYHQYHHSELSYHCHTSSALITCFVTLKADWPYWRGMYILPLILTRLCPACPSAWNGKLLVDESHRLSSHCTNYRYSKPFNKKYFYFQQQHVRNSFWGNFMVIRMSMVSAYLNLLGSSECFWQKFLNIVERRFSRARAFWESVCCWMIWRFSFLPDGSPSLLVVPPT